jgi:lysozyme
MSGVGRHVSGGLVPIVPAERPRLKSAELRSRIAHFNIDRVRFPLVVVGIRGYYKNSMGAPGVNDRGIYDDALFIDTDQATVAYNGNTDPSSFRAGGGAGASKGMASLNPGAWFVHRFDLHKGQYLALCQRAGDVTVTRDGTPPYHDTGEFGINIHRGSFNGTSSAGCQTVHPSQWASFIGLAEDQAKRYFGAAWKARVIPYVLLVE